jgi:hypothetical protein
MARGFIAQKGLEEAVLYRLFEYSQEEEKGASVDGVRGMFDTAISAKRVNLALSDLANRSLIDYSSGSHYVEENYSISRKGYMKVEEDLVKPESFIAQYALQGDDWLTLNIVAPGIPASDRIVSRGDNSEAFAKLEANLQTLSEEVQKSNSIEEELGEPKEVVLGEIAASKVMIREGRFRLKRLIALLLPVLSKLADKFASGAIGQLAKQLMDELAKLL